MALFLAIVTMEVYWQVDDDGPAIPKFGDWDDTDPTAGEGYTQLFNKAREERHNGGSRSPMVTTENNNFYGQNRGNDNTKVRRFLPLNISYIALVFSLVDLE